VPDIFEQYLKTSIFDPPIEDKEVYKNVFSKGNTTGIFQFESLGMKKFLELLKPD
jgi:DNA polymerase III subunit alpha